MMIVRVLVAVVPQVSVARHIEPPGFGEYSGIWRDIFPFFAIIRPWISSRRCECSLRLRMLGTCRQQAVSWVFP